MATPTQKLTTRTAAQLGEDVALAVRVRKCGPSSAKRSDHAGPADAWLTRPISPFPAAGFPIIPMARGLKRAIVDMLAPDHDALCFVLAFTRSGERVLLGRERFRSLHPTRTIRRLEGRPPIDVDLAQLSEQLIPEVTVNGECFIVNSVDFGAMTRAVVNGELDEPQLAEQLTPYYEQAQAFRHYDPTTLRAMMPDKHDAELPS